MSRHVVRALLAAPLLVVVGASHALAANWTPNRVTVASNTTNFAVSLIAPAGMVEFTCAAVVVTSKTEENMPEFGFGSTSFNFRRCAGGMTFAASGLKAKAISTTQANLAIPAKGLVGTFGACKVEVQASEIGQANDWENGNNGKTEPSIWTLPMRSVTIVQNPAMCFNNEGVNENLMTIKPMTFIMQNDTNNEAIKP